MDINYKVRILEVATQGLALRRGHNRRVSIEAICELNNEIAGYYASRLSEHDRVFCEALAKNFIAAAEVLFKNPESDEVGDLAELASKWRIPAGWL